MLAKPQVPAFPGAAAQSCRRRRLWGDGGIGEGDTHTHTVRTRAARALYVSHPAALGLFGSDAQLRKAVPRLSLLIIYVHPEVNGVFLFFSYFNVFKGSFHLESSWF